MQHGTVTVSQLKDEISAAHPVDLRYAEYTQQNLIDYLLLPVKRGHRIPFLTDADKAAIVADSKLRNWHVNFDSAAATFVKSSDAVCTDFKLWFGLGTDVVSSEENHFVVRVRDKPIKSSGNDDDDEYPAFPNNATRREIYETWGVWIMPMPDDWESPADNDEGEDDGAAADMADFIVADPTSSDENDDGDEPPTAAAEQTEEDEINELRDITKRVCGDDWENPRPKRRAMVKAEARLRTLSVEDEDDAAYSHTSSDSDDSS